MTVPAQNFGKYYSKQGIYEWGGKFFTPKWLANPYNMDIMQCKAILEEAYDADGLKWQRGILIAALAKWNQIKQSFGTWIGLAQLHCFDTSVNAGTVPEWARDFENYGGFLIHEYAAGKVVFMRDMKDLYIFFKDSPAPVIETPVPEPEPEPEPQPQGEGCIATLIKILQVIAK